MRRLALLLTLTLTFPGGALAQLISVKSLPVAEGDQFRFFPSERQGMGSVSIALDDASLDPFINPAKGARLVGTRLHTSPTFFGISDDNGSGRTIPVGLLAGSDRWFGGGLLALQQLKSGPRFGDIIIVGPGPFPAPTSDQLSDQSAANLYAAGNLGLRIPGSPLSVGVSAFLADLGMVEAVDQLYALSQDIDQSGHIADFRVGLLGELTGGRSVEAVVLYNRFRMTHDVTYLDWVVTDSVNWIVEQRTRLETNRDETDTWGVHLGYVAPVGERGWKLGGIATGNWKTHPKIPNYEIMNIPRDPGNTSAYNIGIGISRTGGPATLGVDLIYEPIRSHTWADAAEPVVTASGNTIPTGEKTVDNRFKFSNALVRLGVGYELDRVGFQLGLQARSINYDLEQQDLVQETKRQQEEHWMEWTPTWGFALTFPELEVRYQGRVTSGTGRPGVAWTGFAFDRIASAEAADFIVAPGGPLTLQEANVTTHQVSVSLPF